MPRGNIETRGKNSHRIRIYLGRNPDGTKKYHYETFRGTRTDAKKRRTEINRTIDTGGFVARNDMTLGEYLKYWIETGVRPYRAPKTTETYEQASDRIIKKKGHVRLQSLTPLDCQEYYSWALTRGLGERKDGTWRGYSPSTVSIDHRTLHKALEDAVAWGLLGRNVASVVPNKPKSTHRTREVWTPGESSRFLSYIREYEGGRLYAYFILALTAGLRRAELCGLQRSSLHLDKNEIEITHTLVEISERGASRLILQEYEAKTKSSLAPIALSATITRIIRQHLAMQARERLAMGSKYRDQGYVFASIEGDPLRPKNMTKLFPSLCERAGVPILRLHDTRHTYITRILELGVPPHMATKLARHTTWETTVDMYGHITRHAEKQYENVMDHIIPKDTDSERDAQ